MWFGNTSACPLCVHDGSRTWTFLVSAYLSNGTSVVFWAEYFRASAIPALTREHADVTVPRWIGDMRNFLKACNTTWVSLLVASSFVMCHKGLYICIRHLTCHSDVARLTRDSQSQLMSWFADCWNIITRNDIFPNWSALINHFRKLPNTNKHSGFVVTRARSANVCGRTGYLKQKFAHKKRHPKQLPTWGNRWWFFGHFDFCVLIFRR